MVGMQRDAEMAVRVIDSRDLLAGLDFDIQLFSNLADQSRFERLARFGLATR